MPMFEKARKSLGIWPDSNDDKYLRIFLIYDYLKLIINQFKIFNFIKRNSLFTSNEPPFLFT